MNQIPDPKSLYTGSIPSTDDQVPVGAHDGVPVLPYAQIIPGGVARRTGEDGVEREFLRATITLTPDPAGATKQSAFRLHSWPRDIVDAISAGLVIENGQPVPWSIPVQIVPAVYVPLVNGERGKPTPICEMPPLTVRADARLLREAYGEFRDSLTSAVTVWSRSIVGDGDSSSDVWSRLSKRIGLTLGAQATQPGDVATGETTEHQPPQFGKDGQLTQTVDLLGGVQLDSVLAVKHSDLALTLEFQRVEELLNSVREAAEGTNHRLTAEAERIRRAREKVVEPKNLPDGYNAMLPEEQETLLKSELRGLRIEEHRRVRDSLASQRDDARAAYVREQKRAATLACMAEDLSAAWKSRPVFASRETGEQQFDTAGDAHLYATWPQHSTDTDDEDWPGRLFTEKDPEAENAAQAFFTLQSTPSVSRLFGLSIDVEIPLTWPSDDGTEVSLLSKLKAFDALGACPVSSRERPEGFLFVSTSLGCDAASAAGVDLVRPLPWTLAKLRLCDDYHFWPATEEELWLGADNPCSAENVRQFEGHVVMGSGFDATATDASAPRFDLTSLDVRGGTELEMQRRLSRQTNVDSTTAPEVGESDRAYWADLSYAATLQTTGLTLLDRGVQQQAVAKLHAKFAKAEASEAAKDVCGLAVLAATPGCPAGHIVLDAEDITIGVRLDVGVPLTCGGTDWHSLTSRVVSFGTSGEKAETLLNKVLPRLTGGFGEEFRVGLDSALQSSPARMLPNDGEENTKRVEVMMDEAFAHWDGAPMGVDTNRAYDNKGNPVYSNDALVFGRMLSLPATGEIDREFLPVTLRYGRPYRFKLRNVYQGGLSVDPRASEAANSRLGGKVFYPPGIAEEKAYRPYFRFLRQHRVDRPVVLMEEDTASRNNSPMAPENGPDLIVRTLAEDAVGILSGHKRPGRSRRVIIPPSVSLDEAGRHGVFDGIDSKSVRGSPPGVLRGAKHKAGGGFPVTETRTRKGFNDVRHFVSRRIVSAGGIKTADIDYGGSVLVPGDKNEPEGEYYPDPAAEFVAFGLRLPRHETYLDHGAIEPDFCIPVGSRKDYSTFLPLVLELIADTSLTGRVRPTVDQILQKRVKTQIRGMKQAARHIEARLAPGETFELDMWCVPSAESLARDFSLVQSLAIYCAKRVNAGAICSTEAVAAGLEDAFGTTFVKLVAEPLAQAIANGLCKIPVSYVGPGGTVTPHKEVLKVIARALHQQLKTRPLPELAAKTTVVIEHATNRPAVKPALWQQPTSTLTPALIGATFRPEFRLLRPSTEAILKAGPSADGQAAADFHGDESAVFEGSTAYVLDGEIGIPLDTVDSFELVAQAIHPGTKKFDDRHRKRSLARKREGSWPINEGRDGEDVLRTSRDLFGFDVFEDGHVEHPTQEFSLLRVEGLPTRRLHPSGGKLDRLRLRYFFLSDHGTEVQTDPKHQEERELPGPVTKQKWRTVYRHAFPDGKARRLTVTPRVLSRTVGQMETMRMVADDELVPSRPIPADQSFTLGDPVEVMLPATVRPTACNALSPLQTFLWDGTPEWKKGTLNLRRRALVRLPLGREWFSSGEGERVGLVVWPPQLSFADTASLQKDFVPFIRTNSNDRAIRDLSDFIDEDLGPGGSFITRMGADPIRDMQRDPRDHANSGEYKFRPGIFLPLAAFRDLIEPRDEHRRAKYEPAVLMPAEEISKAEGEEPKRGPVLTQQMLTVGLVHYEPLFDPETEQWYIDVALDPFPLSDPFVRFGLVRYQPNTIPQLQISRPVVQWANLMPWRDVEASMDDKTIHVAVTGPASMGAKRLAGHRADLDAPRMRFNLFKEYVGKAGVIEQLPVGLDGAPLVASDGEPPIEAAPSWTPRGSAARPGDRLPYARWDLQIERAAIETTTDASFALYIEEIEWRRPAEYPVEPLSKDQIEHPEKSDLLVESGPRFAARIDLSELVKTASGSK